MPDSNYILHRCWYPKDQQYSYQIHHKLLSYDPSQLTDQSCR